MIDELDAEKKDNSSPNRPILIIIGLMLSVGDGSDLSVKLLHEDKF